MNDVCISCMAIRIAIVYPNPDPMLILGIDSDSQSKKDTKVSKQQLTSCTQSIGLGDLVPRG